MKTKAGWLFALLVSASASGCAYRAGYEAQSGPSGEETGPPVSSYPIPTNDPSGPKGSVNVISLGTERLPVAAGQPDMYLHVRLAAENTSDGVTWTLDPNDQTLASGGNALAPSFAEASTGGPVLTLAAGSRGYLDVFYPVPASSAPTRLSLGWHLQRGNEPVAGTTDLDRVQGPDPTYAYYQPYGPNVYLGFGMGYWWWPDYYFWHHGPYWWPYPRQFGYRSYWGGGWGWGGGYRGGFYGGHVRSPGNWGTSSPSFRSGPSGGGGGGSSSGKSGWRGRR
jgi:hypothetical protein